MGKTKEKRKAIVMGATSGIGKAIVTLLTSSGWEVGIAGRNQSELQFMQSRNMNIIATECIDITDSSSDQLLLKLIGKMDGIDLYFHSSGVGYQNRSLDIDKELTTISTNVMGMTRMVDTCFHYFSKHQEIKGTIAVISSIAGTKGLGPAPAYSSSKRYVSHYIESLTQLCHMKKLKNIKLIDIRPGFVKTPLLNDGNSYPMQMDVSKVAHKIVHAIERGKTRITIDWKYRILVFCWKLIPRWLWVRINL